MVYFCAFSVGFREAWQYNNFMYTTIGYVLEQATGTSWEENIQNKIFTPLGMKNSNFSVAEMQKAANAALPYESGKDGVKLLPYRSIESIGPAGSINSSVNDMTKWVQALLAGGQANGARLVSPGRFAELITPQMALPAGGFPETPFATYAMGWMVDAYRGHTIVHHGGNIDGFSALVSFLPSDGIGIVVLTNANGSPAPTIIERRVIDELLQLTNVDWSSRLKQQVAAIPDELPTAPPQISNTTPSRPLDQFVGTYSHPAYGQVKVVKDEDGLRAKFHHIDEALSHWHYDVFVAKVKQNGITTQVPVQFLSGMDGYVNKVQMVLEASVDPIVFTRVTSLEIAPTVIKALVGKYVAMGTPITLSAKENTLMMEIPGQPPYTLQADQGLRLSVKELPDFYVHYELDEQFKVISITLQQPGGSFEATPVK
ncbi:MAG: serine hydrolase [Bacillota bacterium]